MSSFYLMSVLQGFGRKEIGELPKNLRSTAVFSVPEKSVIIYRSFKLNFRALKRSKMFLILASKI